MEKLKIVLAGYAHSGKGEFFESLYNRMKIPSLTWLSEPGHPTDKRLSLGETDSSREAEFLWGPDQQPFLLQFTTGPVLKENENLERLLEGVAGLIYIVDALPIIKMRESSRHWQLLRRNFINLFSMDLTSSFPLVICYNKVDLLHSTEEHDLLQMGKIIKKAGLENPSFDPPLLIPKEVQGESLLVPADPAVQCYLLSLNSLINRQGHPYFFTSFRQNYHVAEPFLTLIERVMAGEDNSATGKLEAMGDQE